MRSVVMFVSSIFVAGVVVGFFGGKIYTEYKDEAYSLPHEISESPASQSSEPLTLIKAPVEPEIEPVPVTPVEEPDEPYFDVPLSHELQDYIRELCEERGVPMSLILAMIETESAFKADIVSKSNDYGLMQINKINHEWLSRTYNITDFLDPYQNVYCGVVILSQHYRKYQDVDKALMAYNLGESGAKRRWNKGVYETTYTITIKSAMEKYENEI